MEENNSYVNFFNVNKNEEMGMIGGEGQSLWFPQALKQEAQTWKVRSQQDVTLTRWRMKQLQEARKERAGKPHVETHSWPRKAKPKKPKGRTMAVTRTWGRALWELLPELCYASLEKGNATLMGLVSQDNGYVINE